MGSIFKDSVSNKDLLLKIVMPILLLFGFIWWRLGFGAFLVLLIITLVFVGLIKLGFMITEESAKTGKNK
ncbi:hypothetical protein KAU33_04540 [Candidatus Dependentiae bacterium]|nr:hypothetical protein [Candidatus Dependentiae bacterium]